MTMMLARTGWIAVAGALLVAGSAVAQPAKSGCTSAQTAQGTELSVAPAARNEMDTVVALQLDVPADSLPVK